MSPRSLTRPELAVWPNPRQPHRRHESSVPLGSGAELFERAGADLLRWSVKTRSGFRITDPSPARRGERLDIEAGFGPVRVHEPVEVVEVVDLPDRIGFAYRTLPGHPVQGEEAFIVHREGDRVLFTLRSLTRPGDLRRWRLVFPALLALQAITRRRYQRALR